MHAKIRHMQRWQNSLLYTACCSVLAVSNALSHSRKFFIVKQQGKPNQIYSVYAQVQHQIQVGNVHEIWKNKTGMGQNQSRTCVIPSHCENSNSTGCNVSLIMHIQAEELVSGVSTIPNATSSKHECTGNPLIQCRIYMKSRYPYSRLSLCITLIFPGAYFVLKHWIYLDRATLCCSSH